MKKTTTTTKASTTTAKTSTTTAKTSTTTENPEAILPDYRYLPEPLEKGLYESLYNLRWKITTKDKINSFYSLTLQALIDLINVYRVIERECSLLQGFTWENNPWLSADISAFREWISTFYPVLCENIESGKTDNKFFKLCTYYRLEEWQAETGFTIGNLPEAMNNNDIIYNYYHYVEITLERLKTFHVNKNA